MAQEGAETNERAVIGNNSKLSREELEAAFKERTRAQRITENTPFDLRWQWEVWLSDLTPNGKLVALAVRVFASNTGADSRPSIDVLVRLTGLSRQTVVTQLVVIEKALLIVATRGKGRGGNSYTLVVPERTTTEIATVIDFQNSLAARRLTEENSLASRPFPKKNSPPVRPLNDVNSLIGDGNSLAGRLHLTRDITEEEKGRGRTGALGKLAVSIAAGFTVATPAAAASPPVMPPVEQVHEASAECWQTPKAQQAAALDVHELRAQRQVWMTPTGVVEVSGAFKAELIDKFPLVDLHCGLATAAANVRIDRGAITAMQTIRREFGYMQQRESAKAKATGKSTGYQSATDREVERHRELMKLLGD